MLSKVGIQYPISYNWKIKKLIPKRITNGDQSDAIDEQTDAQEEEKNSNEY